MGMLLQSGGGPAEGELRCEEGVCARVCTCEHACANTHVRVGDRTAPGGLLSFPLPPLHPFSPILPGEKRHPGRERGKCPATARAGLQGPRALPPQWQAPPPPLATQPSGLPVQGPGAVHGGLVPHTPVSGSGRRLSPPPQRRTNAPRGAPAVGGRWGAGSEAGRVRARGCAGRVHSGAGAEVWGIGGATASGEAGGGGGHLQSRSGSRQAPLSTRLTEGVRAAPDPAPARPPGACFHANEATPLTRLRAKRGVFLSTGPVRIQERARARACARARLQSRVPYAPGSEPAGKGGRHVFVCGLIPGSISDASWHY